MAGLNAMLAAGIRHAEFIRTSGSLNVSDRRVWESPRALLALPAEAAADLFAHCDLQLVRNCERPACTLEFYDGTKAHQRRWCTMAVCSNRA
jgi:predicted RNA-binding Zn ribbon-like protein